MAPPTPDLAAGFPREDLVRLITQCIHSLGYEGAASTLEKESGIPLLADSVRHFRSGILEGRWDEVETLVDKLELRSEDSRVDVHFLVLRQKFLELVEAQRVDEALRCLRQQLAPLDKKRVVTDARSIIPSPGVLKQAQSRLASTPLPPNPRQLLVAPGAKAAADAPGVGEAAARCLSPPSAQPPQPPPLSPLSVEGAQPQPGGSVPELSCYLMCKSGEELRAHSGWDGAAGQSRRLLLQELQRYVPPTHLLP